ncbi:hypothetical protein N7478_012270 [Penicillium angulare]|uniref:uncharacterized protein n=1 Tax=Penicillium angulare TaxID=116970 RepID=UPI0025417231|nr:uncharacterized protein N7478_012270 [Penicillium angulare]KAJ5259289.1 hypothetical protein N7478_012270 [Penicillium angulare]
MFDAASRGALGSMTFLWSGTHIRQYASLGAVVTIIAIGVGPFIQQMPTIQNNLVLSNTPASVARAQSYVPPLDSDVGNGSLPAPKLMAAVYGTAFSCPDTDCSSVAYNVSYPVLKPSCSTGDCDISDLTTVALCVACDDISHVLSRKPFPMSSVNCSAESNLYDYYSLPNGFNATIFDGDYTKNGNGNSDAAVIKTDTGPFLDFTVIKKGANQTTSEGVAELCNLYWCLKTMSVSMETNQRREETLSTHLDSGEQFEIEPYSYLMLQMPNKTTQAFTIVSDNIFERWLEEKIRIDTFGMMVCPTTTSGEVVQTFNESAGEFASLLI